MIIQPAFEVPPAIVEGLVSGDLIRFGGVVRDTAGRLVTHLKEVPAPEMIGQGPARRAAVSFRDPWIAVGTGAVLLVAFGGGIYSAVKKSQSKGGPEMPEWSRRYNQSLRAYLEAIQNGRLNSNIIDNMMTDLDAVIAHSNQSDYTVAFLPEQHSALTAAVLDYTRKLAKANGYELSEALREDESTAVEAIATLRQCLQTQKRIFAQAA